MMFQAYDDCIFIATYYIWFALVSLLNSLKPKTFNVFQQELPLNEMKLIPTDLPNFLKTFTYSKITKYPQNFRNCIDTILIQTKQRLTYIQFFVTKMQK